MVRAYDGDMFDDEREDMPKKRRYTFTISLVEAEKHFTRFLDMMRHDSARVINWYTLVIVLQTESHAPTEDRWASMGLYVLSKQEGDYPDVQYLAEQAHEKLP